MNAKDLGLAKLNAGSTMIGAYIYGISIGMDFLDISKILMSPTGRIIKDIIDENVMQSESGQNKLEQAFAYFGKKGPTKRLSKFNTYASTFEERKAFGDNYMNPLEWLKLRLNPNFDKKRHPLLVFLKGKTVALAINLLESYRKEYTALESDKVLLNKLIDFCEEYAIQYKSLDFDRLDLLKLLSKGGEEMRKIGLIVGLNQGIPTDLTGILSKIELIEHILDPLLEENEDKWFKIDLQKFAFDQKYRKKCISAYEHIKTSFNALDLVDKVPHVLKYVLLLSVVDSMAKSSYKYRAIRDTYFELKGSYNLYSSEDVIRSLNNFMSNKIIADWMLDTGKVINIPAGNKLFTPDGVLLEEDTTLAIPVRLGFDYSNASFRRWMETEVIPNLQLGYIGNNQEEGTILKSNLFISSLRNDLRTNTLSGNGTFVYSLPINMMPRTDAERNILNNYIDSFNQLDRYSYYNDGKAIPLTDLFTLYALIAHEGKLGESSLMPILEKYLNLGLLRDLHTYESQLDESGTSIQLSSTLLSQLNPYMASRESPYSATGAYAWGLNEEHDRMELMSKGRETYQGDFGSYKEPGLGNYAWISRITENIDTNYFPNLAVNNREESFKESFKSIDNKNYNIRIIWTRGLGKDTVSILDEHGEPFIQLKLGNIPVKTRNGVILPDMTLIKKIVRAELQKLADLKENNNETCTPAPF